MCGVPSNGGTLTSVEELIKKFVFLLNYVITFPTGALQISILKSIADLFGLAARGEGFIFFFHLAREEKKKRILWSNKSNEYFCMCVCVCVFIKKVIVRVVSPESITVDFIEVTIILFFFLCKTVTGINISSQNLKKKWG